MGADGSRPTAGRGQATDRPIGIFDSGVGGLSILRHIRTLLPQENLIYLADTGFAPYGDRPEQQILSRSLAIAGFMLDHGVKALVVACNTATAAAIEAIRLRYPELVVVGVEPGLKPAALGSLAKLVGVLATTRTLTSPRFLQLRDDVQIATGVRFLLQPCPGLADCIEQAVPDISATASMITSFLQPLLHQGIDTLVLGCTHYPFAQPLINYVIASNSPSPGQSVTVIDTGAAVARQLANVLRSRGQVRLACAPGVMHAYASGDTAVLSTAFSRLLGMSAPVTVGFAGPLRQGRFAG
ncbi:MAG: glutamate racemase [Burkholderiaceae bacterium]